MCEDNIIVNEWDDEVRPKRPKLIRYLLLIIPISMLIGYFFIAVVAHFKHLGIIAEIRAKGEPVSHGEPVDHLYCLSIGNPEEKDITWEYDDD